MGKLLSPGQEVIGAGGRPESSVQSFKFKYERPGFSHLLHKYTNSVCTFTDEDFVTSEYVVSSPG